MASLKLPTLGAMSCVFFLSISSTVRAQSLAATRQETDVRQETLNQALTEHGKLLLNLETVRQQFSEQKALLESLERQIAKQKISLDELQGKVGWDVLATQRGTGTTGAPVPSSAPSSDSALAPALELQAQAEPSQVKPVGQAPSVDRRPPEVAPLFEQPGVLTQKGHYVMEPSLQYSYSSTDRVAVIGYTIIPALLIGLLDVRQVKRNTLTAAIAARFGVTNRLEMELRVPYIDRFDDTVSRGLITPNAGESVFSASGAGIGDIELGARYQLNDGGVDRPFYIGTMRFKTRTGKDPFEVVTDCNQVCVGNATGTGLPLDLPTGSGFYSLQGGVTVLYPSDPAVFFGSLTYTHNFARDDVSRNVLNGQREFLGKVAPGDVVGFNFGMGLALNEKSSFSLGYDHSSVGRTELNGQVVPGSVRTQLATLLLGYSYRLSGNKTLNVSIGAGLTRDTPDLTLTVRLPMTF